MTQMTETRTFALHSERRPHCDSLSYDAVQSAAVLLKDSCSLSCTKSIISCSFFKGFLDQLLCFVRREIDEISISCEGPLAMHICAEKRRDKRYHKCI